MTSHTPRSGGPLPPPSPPGPRASLRVQHVRSPQTHVGYALAKGSAYLILLAAGQLRLPALAGADVSAGDAPRLLWRADGADEVLIAEGGARAILVSVPALALAGALPVSPLGEQMQRTLRQDLAFPMDAEGRIRTLVEGLGTEREAGEPAADVAAGHYLSLILVHLWRMARADLIAHGRAPQGLAERFVLMAGSHRREHWKIADYARHLGVSRDRLGSAVQRATGLSPQAYLHQLLVREASELLASTGMPVGQVAFRLGFADPAYFTRFFTRHRGETPVRFRRAAKARRATGDLTYAAWP